MAMMYSTKKKNLKPGRSSLATKYFSVSIVIILCETRMHETHTPVPSLPPANQWYCVVETILVHIFGVLSGKLILVDGTVQIVVERRNKQRTLLLCGSWLALRVHACACTCVRVYMCDSVSSGH